MIDKQFQTLNCNSFIVGTIFQAFYEGYNNEFCPISLHYIVAPIIMYKDTRELFTKVNKNSSLGKIFKENQVPFIEFQERLWKMRKLTHLSLIGLHNQDKIELTSEVRIIETINYENSKIDLKPYLRAAYYTGLLFKDFNEVDIYKIFKIVP